MDTPRSGFLTAFEHFWNGWGAHQDNLMLIVCGSATSWISDKLINNKGGLYNRVTNEIKLKPFTLAESEEYYKSNGIVMSRYDQLQCYMAIGGIPFYMSLLKRGVSLAQNIDMLFFEQTAKLKQEFSRLYGSLFTNYEECEKIIRLLNRAMADINGGQPLTHFTIWQFAESWDDTLIVDGAVVFAMISEGILQLRNQVDFSDSGLTIGMFNKTQLYQGWVSFLLQHYFQAKADLKAAVVAKNQPSMFVGIGSEFGYYWW